MATSSASSTGSAVSTTAQGPSPSPSPGPSPSSASGGNHGGAVAGAVIGALLALVLLAGVYYWRRSGRSQHAQLTADSSAVRAEKPRQAYLNPSFDESLLPPDEVDVAQDGEGTSLEDRPPGRSRDAWDNGTPLQPIPRYYDTPASTAAGSSSRGISSSGGARQIDEDDALVSETSA
jgi:hypothetical protein